SRTPSPTSSRAATRPATTATCGRKCSAPMPSPPSRRPASSTAPPASATAARSSPSAARGRRWKASSPSAAVNPNRRRCCGATGWRLSFLTRIPAVDHVDVGALVVAAGLDARLALEADALVQLQGRLQGGVRFQEQLAAAEAVVFGDGRLHQPAADAEAAVAGGHRHLGQLVVAGSIRNQRMRARDLVAYRCEGDGAAGVEYVLPRARQHRVVDRLDSDVAGRPFGIEPIEVLAQFGREGHDADLRL